MRRKAERAPGRPAVADPDAPPAAARQPTCTRRGQRMLAWVDWRLLYTLPATPSAVMSLTFVVLSMLRSATSARSAATGDSDRLAQLMNFVASSSSVRRPG